MRKALRPWMDLDLQDYARLLALKRRYKVTEIEVDEDNWLADRKTKELRLADKGIAVLGIERKDRNNYNAPVAKQK